MPKRIQRKRTKGWKMPEGAVYVGRPSMFGNPFHLWIDCDQVDLFRWWLSGVEGRQELRHRLCYDKHPELTDTKIDSLLARRAKLLRYIGQLRGRDLACWCPLDQRCHADVLLELANQ